MISAGYHAIFNRWSEWPNFNSYSRESCIRLSSLWLYLKIDMFSQTFSRSPFWLTPEVNFGENFLENWTQLTPRRKPVTGDWRMEWLEWWAGEPPAWPKRTFAQTHFRPAPLPCLCLRLRLCLCVCAVSWIRLKVSQCIRLAAYVCVKVLLSVIWCLQ